MALRPIFFAAFLLIVPGFAFGVENLCVTCHKEAGGELANPVKEWEMSIHKRVGVSCSNCHGGDPSVSDPEKAMSKARGFVGRPDPKAVPGLCASCHADVAKMRQFNIRTDQFAEYKTSIHGKLLFEKGDRNVATCTSCHGKHDIRKKDDPASSVYRLNVPETCSKCHSNAALMKQYKIPYNQFEEYKKSYHGYLLLERADQRAPNCADCHGIHGATPPGVTEVANVCGNCHSAVADYFKQGPHQRAVNQLGVPKCINCHGNHKIVYPTLEMLSGDKEGECASCHDKNSPQVKLALNMKELLENTERTIKRAEEGIRDVKRRGFEVSELEALLDGAKAKVTEAKPITHSLILAKVEAPIKDAVKSSARVEERVRELKQESRVRMMGLTGVLFIGVLMIFFLYLKKKSLEAQEEEGEV